VLRATDLVVEQSVVLELESAPKGADIMVGSKQLHAAVQTLGSGIVELDDNKDDLVLRTASTEFRLLSGMADDYPTAKSCPEMLEPIDKDALLSVIKQALVSVSTQPTRPFLCGAKVIADGTRFQATSVDGHRLTRASAACGLKLSGSPIIPTRGLCELQRMCAAAADSDIAMALDDEWLYATSDGEMPCVLAIRCVQGEPPDVDSLIRSGHKSTMVAERDEWMSALRRMKVVSDEHDTGVDVELSKGRIVRFSCESPMLGVARDQITLTAETKPARFRANINYMIDALKSLPSGHVAIGVESPEQGIQIEPLEQADGMSSVHSIWPQRR